MLNDYVSIKHVCRVQREISRASYTIEIATGGAKLLE